VAGTVASTTGTAPRSPAQPRNAWVRHGIRNGQHDASTDSGAQAEPEESGGRFVSISPGLSYAVSQTLQVYAFVQLPVYQYVNGVQLTASKAFVAGVSGRF